MFRLAVGAVVGINITSLVLFYSNTAAWYERLEIGGVGGKASVGVVAFQHEGL